MRSQSLEEAVFDRWGRACVLCGRTPEEWLETDLGTRHQTKLSFYHVNGDDTDDRVENVIPLCQSCHVHIHRVDEPPYRKWHRQLPIEHRHAWNAYHHEYYEGPRLTRAEAERRFGDDAGVPESVKYLEHERKDYDSDEDTSNTPDADETIDSTEIGMDGSNEPSSTQSDKRDEFDGCGSGDNNEGTD